MRPGVQKRLWLVYYIDDRSLSPDVFCTYMIDVDRKKQFNSDVGGRC